VHHSRERRLSSLPGIQEGVDDPGVLAALGKEGSRGIGRNHLYK
jgi:hypothetical protein